MQTRRMFVQAGAALALPAIGGVLLTRDRGIAAAACTTCADDPVSAEAMRQFKAAIRAFKRSAKGEHARRAGAALRVVAANARERNLDADFRRAAQREVNTYGRDNVLTRPFDRERFAAIAREFGVTPAPEVRMTTLAERAQALDELLSTGIAAYMERGAEFFEAAGAQLDARGPVQQVQTKEEQIAMCRNLQNYVFSTEVAMILACLLGGPFACAFATGVYLGAKIHYETQTDCWRWL